MRKVSAIFVTVLLFVGAGYSQKLTIAAAADLRYALTEVTAKYKEVDSSYKIDLIFGSSGNLYQQIVNQAPFDIYFSADNSYPQKLEEQKLIVGKPKLYAIGHLVLWSSNKDISKGPQSLQSTDIKKIAIANPAVAPYGKRAMECLQYYKLDGALKDKIVIGENVSQAAQFVLTGNADVGIIALSLAISGEMTGKGKYYTIDEKSYSPLEQSFVLLKRAENNKSAANFIKYLSSENVRKIFRKFGFKLPDEK